MDRNGRRSRLPLLGLLGVALAFPPQMPLLAGAWDGLQYNTRPPPEDPITPPETPPPQPPDSGYGGGDDDGGRGWLGPAIAVGAIALVAIADKLWAESKASDNQTPPEDQSVNKLLEYGPQLPGQFNMSAFAIRGLVKGGWPVVVDYEQHSAGPVSLQISAKGGDIIRYPLDPIGPGRHLVKFDLPGFLGDDLKPALVALTATRDQDRQATQGDFRIHALGVGPRAVGSAAIDQLDFNPANIRVRHGETALYQFYSHSDFDNLAVEFLHTEDADDGVRNRYVRRVLIPGGVSERQWIGLRERREWDGRDEYAEVSPGAHKLQVRAWDDGGDWIGAWSPSSVTVRN